MLTVSQEVSCADGESSGEQHADGESSGEQHADGESRDELC